jgi:hypothetical protein
MSIPVGGLPAKLVTRTVKDVLTSRDLEDGHFAIDVFVSNNDSFRLIGTAVRTEDEIQDAIEAATDIASSQVDRKGVGPILDYTV